MTKEIQKIKHSMEEIISSDATEKEKIKAAEILLEIYRREEAEEWNPLASKQE